MDRPTRSMMRENIEVYIFLLYSGILYLEDHFSNMSLNNFIINETLPYLVVLNSSDIHKYETERRE